MKIEPYLKDFLKQEVSWRFATDRKRAIKILRNSFNFRGYALNRAIDALKNAYLMAIEKLFRKIFKGRI